MRTISREERVKEILSRNEGELKIVGIASVSTPKRKVQPRMNKTRTSFLGINSVKEREKKDRGEPYIDPEDPTNPLGSVTLESGKTFDLSNPDDKTILSWLLYCDNVLALDYDDLLRENRSATYYIFEEENDLKKQESRNELEDEALSILRDLNNEDLKKVGRNLGIDVQPNSKNQMNALRHVRLTLRERIKESIKKSTFDLSNTFAKQFIKAVNDANKDVKYFIHQAYDRQIIRKSEGAYYFNETYLGRTVPEVIAFINKANNYPIVDSIRQQLGYTQVNVSLSTSEEAPSENKEEDKKDIAEKMAKDTQIESLTDTEELEPVTETTSEKTESNSNSKRGRPKKSVKS